MFFPRVLRYIGMIFFDCLTLLTISLMNIFLWRPLVQFTTQSLKSKSMFTLAMLIVVVLSVKLWFVVIVLNRSKFFPCLYLHVLHDAATWIFWRLTSAYNHARCRVTYLHLYESFHGWPSNVGKGNVSHNKNTCVAGCNVFVCAYTRHCKYHMVFCRCHTQTCNLGGSASNECYIPSD